MESKYKNIIAFKASESEPPPTQEDALSYLEALQEKPTSEQVREALSHFRDAVKRMDEVSRELARDAAVKRLRGLGFLSPGRIVEAAMPPGRNGEERKNATAFQDPDLWPEPVDGSDLLSELEKTVRRFVALTPEQCIAYVLWALFAHAHDAFEISPILAFTSPDKGCGKSTALALLSALVPKPLTSANITPSAVFRATERYKPCLLLDEADTFLSDSEGLRGILNSGHMRSQAYVTRVAGDEHHVYTFSTWAPKAVALIGELPPTLADRAVAIRMRRRTYGEAIERLQLHKLCEMEDLRSRAARWASDHIEDMRTFDPAMPEGITKDRARDNWRPLLAIADFAGQEWPRRARECASRLCASTQDDSSAAITLLSDLRALFRNRSADRLSSEEILASLHRMEERPWPEWRDRSPMTPRQMAVILHRFGIAPVKWRQETETLRGYQRSDFGDAFSRYLPPDPPQAPHASLQNTYNQNLSATEMPENADFDD